MTTNGFEKVHTKGLGSDYDSENNDNGSCLNLMCFKDVEGKVVIGSEGLVLEDLK